MDAPISLSRFLRQPREEKGRGVESPMQLRYMMIVRSLMHYLDTWPYAVFEENVSPYPFRGRKFLFVYWMLTLYVCIWFVKTNIGVDASSLSKYGSITVVVMCQLIQMSAVVELVTSKSEEVMNAVYSVPWERMSASNRNMVALFLFNAQNPMQLKAMGMVPVGLQTMAGILKTSLSYFMLLRSFAD
ncbi:unnamed protein product [Chilo suppressalis]|uniref:Odorant receptor n=1 Tax=Chilo suppressalis TaxID=168631 RepID=A0ABN8AYY2_CHISP|nr:unnamed protein product [Chilo suppressalis]